MENTKRRLFAYFDISLVYYYSPDSINFTGKQDSEEFGAYLLTIEPLGKIDVKDAYHCQTYAGDGSTRGEWGFQLYTLDRVWELWPESKVSQSTWMRLLVTAIRPRIDYPVRIANWLSKEGRFLRSWTQRWYLVDEKSIYYFENPSRCALFKFLLVNKRASVEAAIQKCTLFL